MIKILWADDDPELTSTFSHILNPLKPKILSVTDGSIAIKKVKEEYFDLVILDLLMPPNKWGGLWFLKELKKLGYRIPVLILSGEGTQSETIRALRLGASDYVTKSDVDKDLLPQVENTLRQLNKDIKEFVLLSFPTPLAIGFKRFQNTSYPVSKLKRLIEFFEISLKLSCIMGLSESNEQLLISPPPRHLVQSILRGPPLGVWNQLRILLSKNLPESSSFSIFHMAFNDSVVKSIIQIRNDISHGTDPSEIIAKEIIEKYEPELDKFLFKIWQRLNFQIILPRNLSFDGNEFLIECKTLVGDSVALPSVSLTSTSPPVIGQAHLKYGSDNNQVWHNLFPFLILEQSSEPTTWQVLFYDSVKFKHNLNNLSGEELILYVDLWTGKRKISPSSKPMFNDLPDFLKSSV